nr:MAG TPA: PVL ORF-50-like family [Bacteriophage sp.]
MGRTVDITGQKFGRLKAIEPVGRDKHNSVLWRCKCDCGNETITTVAHLRSGHTKSCGCFMRETSAINMHNAMFKTGCSLERLYAVWSEMMLRCNKPTNKAYKHYGGRGIKVCKEWQDYLVFKEWAYSHGYDENAKRHECTIDRIDVNGNYCPENCRWATNAEQSVNKQDTVYVELNGERMALSQAAEKLRMNYGTLNSRINKLHWPVEKALSTSVRDCGWRRHDPDNPKPRHHKKVKQKGENNQ